MVSEVEFGTKVDIAGNIKSYTYSNDVELFTGTLSGNGTTLNITVNAQAPCFTYGARKVFVRYVNIDFENNLVLEVPLGESEITYNNIGATLLDGIIREYSFDLSSVLKIPRKIYNTQGSSEIAVELYTYESNINTDYGSKRLSVPYTITSDTKYRYDKSTDGVYKIFMVDFSEWLSTVEYGKGDVVLHGGNLYVSLVERNNMDLSDRDFWTEATDNDVHEYAHGVTENPPIRANISYFLISRYAKYNMILNTLLTGGFKAYDDSDSDKLCALLQHMREKAVYELKQGRVIDAAYSMQQLKLAYSNMSDKTEIINYNINYTV